MRSGIANASSRGRTSTRTSRAAASSSLTVASISSTRSPRHPLELEVHPARAGLHVAAGHERPVVAPHDAAQGMERRVGPHQGVAAGPVEIDRHGRRRPRAARRPRAPRARGRSRRRRSALPGPSSGARRRSAGSPRGRRAGRRRPGRTPSRRARRAARAVAPRDLDDPCLELAQYASRIADARRRGVIGTTARRRVSSRPSASRSCPDGPRTRTCRRRPRAADLVVLRSPAPVDDVALEHRGARSRP